VYVYMCRSCYYLWGILNICCCYQIIKFRSTFSNSVHMYGYNFVSNICIHPVHHRLYCLFTSNSFQADKNIFQSLKKTKAKKTLLFSFVCKLIYTPNRGLSCTISICVHELKCKTKLVILFSKYLQKIYADITFEIKLFYRKKCI
jgi:hypothetical protein